MKDIVALKENLIEQIEKHQKSIEMLEKNLTILDLALKESSFTKASQLDKTKKVIQNKTDVSLKNLLKIQFQLKEGNDGKIIANAFVTPEQVSIVLDDEVEIKCRHSSFQIIFFR